MSAASKQSAQAELGPDDRAVIALLLSLLYVQEDYSAMRKLSELLSRVKTKSPLAERLIVELQIMSRDLSHPPIEALEELLA
jgi:hypothetical protein